MKFKALVWWETNRNFEETHAVLTIDRGIFRTKKGLLDGGDKLQLRREVASQILC